MSTVTFRDILEAFAGYRPEATTGTKVLPPCAACYVGACERCQDVWAVGAMTYICSCDCHGVMDPADWDAAYGTPWYAEQKEQP